MLARQGFVVFYELCIAFGQNVREAAALCLLSIVIRNDAKRTAHVSFSIGNLNFGIGSAPESIEKDAAGGLFVVRSCDRPFLVELGLADNLLAYGRCGCGD